MIDLARRDARPSIDPSPGVQRVRVLVVHNFYAWRGGEDHVVDDEVRLLRDHGHSVELYARTPAEVAAAGSARLALDAVWSRRTHDEVGALLDRLEPDVVHVHNTVPLVSPSVYWTAARRGVAVVQTIHNFRIACLAGTLMRDGRICEDCVGKLPWRGVVRGCYRGSRVQSAGLATTLTTHRLLRSHQRHVAVFIALTAFARAKLMDAGLPPERIAVKPNGVEVPPPSAQDDALRGGGLYVGRLSAEKGIDTLAAACAHDRDARVTIIGDGPLGTAASTVRAFDRRGAQPAQAVHAAMRRARYLVMPSRSYEGFPRVLAEAFGSGLPVIASRIGSLAELVEHGVTGLLVKPGNAAALAEAMRWAECHPDEMAAMGANARRVYTERYTPARNHAGLMAIYERARATVAARHAAPAGSASC